VAVPAAEEDLDLGELTLRDVPAGLGLGLILGEMAFDEDRPQPTLIVLTILPKSPAHLAGIRPLDAIVQVNGRATRGRHPAELFDVGVGDQVSVTLEDGRQLALTAVAMEQLYEQSGMAPQDIAGKLESQSGWY
jgi:S1-C subfamily serine protease